MVLCVKYRTMKMTIEQVLFALMDKDVGISR